MGYKIILDTTSKFLVVGLADDNKVIDEIVYEAIQRQSEFIVLEINNILERNNIKIDDVKEIIVSNGPGSYTGVRIALTIAKVWGLCKKTAIKVISSLGSMCDFNTKSIAILDARSKRFYVGMYYKGEVIKEDCILELDELNELRKNNPDYVLVGDIDKLGLEYVQPNYVQNMFDLAKVSKISDNIDLLVPKYLKEVY